MCSASGKGIVSLFHGRDTRISVQGVTMLTSRLVQRFYDNLSPRWYECDSSGQHKLNRLAYLYYHPQGIGVDHLQLAPFV